MAGATQVDRRTYELTNWRVPGPVEPIPVYLYHRSDIAGPKPAVVYYHGVVQSKEVYVSGHPLARRLADAGFAVAIPDAPGHGERAAGATLIERLRESLPREFTRDIEQAADEAPALLDWLGTIPDVDASRIGITGISMGGFTTAVVAARVRDRIRAAVPIAGSADLAHCMATTDSINPNGWGPQDRSIDEETTRRIARIDPLGYPEKYAPLPLLLLHGERDTWNPPVTSERLAEQVRPTYASAPDSFKLTVVPNAPHWPPGPQFVDDTVNWLTRYVSQSS